MMEKALAVKNFPATLVFQTLDLTDFEKLKCSKGKKNQ